MFGTLRYDQGMIVEGHAYPTPARLACSYCRSKKLKCSGQKTGCARCLSRKSKCEYPAPSKDKRRRFTSTKARFESRHAGSLSTTPVDLQATPRERDVHLAQYLDIPIDESLLTWNEGSNQPIHDIEILENSNNTGTEAVDFTDINFVMTESPPIFLDNFLTNVPDVSRRNMSSQDALLLSVSDDSPPTSTQNSQYSIPSGVISCSAGAQPSERPSLGQQHSGSQFGIYSAAPQPCQCITSALTLIDAIAISDTRIGIQNVAYGLQLNKRALSLYARMLSCCYCCSSSVSNPPRVIHLILLCEKIMESYEHIIGILKKCFEKLITIGRERVVMSELNAWNDGEWANQIPIHNQQDRSVQENSLSADYQIDMLEEPCVFGRVISTQLGSLRALVVQLKSVLRGKNLDTHVLIADAVDEKVKKLLWICTGEARIMNSS
ncbi:hypothetical protein B7463_g12405, partial [Scytalidium lignicola]